MGRVGRELVVPSRRRQDLETPRPLDNFVMLTRLDAREFLCRPARPTNSEHSDLSCTAQSKMDPLRGLGNKTFPGPQRLHESVGRGIGQFEFHARADSIPIRPAPLQTHGQVLVIGRMVVAQKPNPGPASVDQPKVQIPISIPIRRGNASPVVQKI